ncbi:MAG: hypothetical protein A2W91_18110 [Bacteroidetes bacterium GWF2_38_335]|nr:MAG: hypothetical protein A2W91_18110 [Bacteroidetes bacterium GWF2_38_335]OFY80118.1 MAG: hypothetical protein A2281_12530 [Bacteroidetes bacterium RIFOXYA12_FULL_38_20]HBS88555.1 hypothetical protein [Bacteroidales bacterium]
MEENNEKKIQETAQDDIACISCGSSLKFKPGSTMLKCDHCGAENPIDIKQENIEEIDFEKFLSENTVGQDKQEIVTVKCKGCGAETTFKPNVVSDFCAFCGTPMVVKEGTNKSVIKPKSLLPFIYDSDKAFEQFRKWLRKLWFAPSGLKEFARQAERLQGMYIPYWTYDSKTDSSYTGQRGDDYYVTETYTDNGQSKTRQVKKTRWTFVSGRVNNIFDDILILASKSLPKKKADKLEPWDLKNLVPFDEKFLAGFKTESYQVELKDGFDQAKVIMDSEIRVTIKKNIGGDHQRIFSVNTAYNDITFKHVLLPVWISAYRYKEKVYRFMVNARTGEVQGERPWSWVKIALAVVAGLAVIGGIVYLVMQNQ